MYPSTDQRILINKTLGSVRFVYNYYLSLKKRSYEINKQKKSNFDCIKDLVNLTKENVWLKEVDSMSLRCSLFDLDDAIKRFFHGSGYPKYKSKYNDRNSYRTNYISNTYKGKRYENIKVDLKEKMITLPKLKEVKIRGYRHLKKLEERIINATITKETTGKYYVSVLVEAENKYESTEEGIIGIDLGITTLVTTSNGEKYDNPKALSKHEKRIQKLQRRLSKKVKGSNNYQKLKYQLSRLHEKVRNTRKHIIHNITNKIVRANNIIVTESLKIENMLRNHNLSKSIQDASWKEVIRQLEYKSEWYKKKLYQIDTYYASSQECNRCGNKNKAMKDLKIRKYECSRCGNEEDRDINASINIMFEGLKQYLKEANV